jgi:hypothetical protein
MHGIVLVCVDSPSQKVKVKSDGQHVATRLQLVGLGHGADFNEMVYYGNRDGEFVLGGILASVRLDLSLDSYPVLAFAAVVGRVRESFQFEHLADGMKRDLNGASSDFMAVPAISCPCPASETEKEIDSVGV